MELKKRAPKDFSIDISSLVDVLFTLLIFFSLTSTFVKESGLKVDLPKASSDTPIVSAEKFEIVSIAAEQSHGGVIVNIVKGRHDREFAAAVDDGIRRARLLPDGGKAVPLDSHAGADSVQDNIFDGY